MAPVAHFLFLVWHGGTRYDAERWELSHAGPMKWTANAELKAPTRVGSSDLLGHVPGSLAKYSLGLCMSK